MSRIVASPLGDLEISRLRSRHWSVGVAAALFAHVVAAAAYWAWAPEPKPKGADEVAIGVTLGPPGGRLDREPPPQPKEAPPPTPPAAPTELTERAADAPPVELTAPPPPAAPNAALSSGFGEGGGGPPPIVDDRPAFDRAQLRVYTEKAAALINEQIIYPERAREDRVEGTAMIRLLVDKDGRLLESELVQSSGNPLLDEAIMRGVSKVRRFPALPRDYPRARLRFSVAIRFMLILD
jgi:protein TonB